MIFFLNKGTEKRRKKQGKKINHITKYGFTKQLNGGGGGGMEETK